MTLGTYGIMLAVAFLCAFYVLDRDLRRRHLPGDAQVIILWLAVAGIVGARLWHVLESPRELLEHLAEEMLSTAGFAWFGGFVAGIVTLALLARHYRIPLLVMLDAASPAAALGYAIGRIGCLVSGDGDYGIPTSLPWGMSFPNGLVPTVERVHPTPIYEFLAGVLIFWFLWREGGRAAARQRPAGWVLGEYLLLTGLARFLVEFIRINPRVIFGMSNAQAMALVSAVAGFVLLATKRRGRQTSGAR